MSPSSEDSPARMSPWVQHDRTHLELLTHLPIPQEGQKAEYRWEAFFLLPRSLRINATTFSDAAFRRSMQSYVRLVPPSLPVAELAAHLDSGLIDVRARPEECIRQLKLFGCMAKVSLLAEQRRLLELLRRGGGESSSRGEAPQVVAVAVESSLQQLSLLVRRYRNLLPQMNGERAATSAKWVDAYLARLLEDVLVKLSIKLQRRGHAAIAQAVTAAAVREAQYAIDNGLTQLLPDSEGRDVEAVEAIAHYLKRFTSSVLWLRQDRVAVGNWLLQLLYGVAASIAMAFAAAIALYNGGPREAHLRDLWLWVLVVVLGYAGKDRMKAMLQGFFSRWIAERLPDRRWKLSIPGAEPMGHLQERSAFVSRSKVPVDAMVPPEKLLLGQLRSAASLGNVLWYSKQVVLGKVARRAADTAFAQVVEIVRLDVSRWLMHADNSPRKIYFADVEDCEAKAASAPRTYTIEIVHRLTSAQQSEAPWQTTRVVVDREGIRSVRAAHRRVRTSRGQMGRTLFEAPWEE